MVQVTPCPGTAHRALGHPDSEAKCRRGLQESRPTSEDEERGFSSRSLLSFPTQLLECNRCQPSPEGLLSHAEVMLTLTMSQLSPGTGHATCPATR